jgi:hypothetical protein
MKQAIREVLLSDEFMTTFAAAFLSATVPRSTLEHPIPGVNRPMRSEAQLSKMVELDMDNLITLCREHHFRIGHDPSGGWEPTKDEIEYAKDRCGVPASEPINPSESPNSSSKPWVPKIGERVRLIETGDIYEIGSYSETYAQYSMQGWPGSCVNLEDIEPVNCPEIPDSSSEPTPKPSKTQPPSDYRMLGSAKDEPRQASDLYWSLSAKNWIPIKLKQVEYANRDDWVACRKIEVTSPSPKRYREPTLADLTNGPIACEYRDCDDEHWRGGFLVHILNGAIPFLCVDEQWKLSGQWEQCRIEVTE